MNKLNFLLIPAIVALLEGCSSAPTLGDQMIGRGKELIKEGNAEWEQGSLMVEQGKAKVERGNRMVDDGKQVDATK